MTSSILLTVNGAAAHIVLNRPLAGNALTLEMSRALLDAAIACEAASSVRVVVLTGAGKMFCAGGDLRGMQDAGAHVSRYLNELTTNMHSAITCFSRMKAVVLAAVNGTAAGAGLGLVAMADLAIAVSEAKFTSGYTAVGLTPDAGVSFLLPRSIGRKRALDMMVTNRVINAQQALDWGLISEISPAAEFEDVVQRRTAELAARPGAATADVKALMNAADPGLETQMVTEGRCIANAAARDDARSAIEAFLSRRNPS